MLGLASSAAGVVGEVDSLMDGESELGISGQDFLVAGSRIETEGITTCAMARSTDFS
jgi:hypothetical protein